MAPLYWRFCFKPSDGSVLLSHNQETHPTEVKTHGSLALEANEPGLVHGYAYRIHGGWRLHDYEHRPLTDPFIKAQVAKALARTRGEAPSPVEQDNPAPIDDSGQFHYGQPSGADPTLLS